MRKARRRLRTKLTRIHTCSFRQVLNTCDLVKILFNIIVVMLNNEDFIRFSHPYEDLYCRSYGAHTASFFSNKSESFNASVYGCRKSASPPEKNSGMSPAKMSSPKSMLPSQLCTAAAALFLRDISNTVCVTALNMVMPTKPLTVLPRRLNASPT